MPTTASRLILISVFLIGVLLSLDAPEASLLEERVVRLEREAAELKALVRQRVATEAE